MSEILNVLIVEDSITDAKLVVHELETLGQEIHWERVEEDSTMRAALAEKRWNLIISDWTMPKFTGARALAMVKELHLDVPFIIVSGSVGEDLAVEAMRSGANDYVLKDRLARLAPAADRELREAKVRQTEGSTKEQLRISEARFARLYESGIIGISITDIFGKIHDANDAFLSILGYTREDLESGSLFFSDVTPADWKEVDDVSLERLKSGGVAPPQEKEMVRKDGLRVPILVGVAMLDYPNCIAVLADLTAQKRAEAALFHSEERLLQAQKMEAVGRLAGGVAHDFNNILTVILSYCSLLKDDLPETNPMLADVDQIHVAATRAADLTRQLLAFSRQQVLQPRIADLTEIVTNLEKMLRRLIGEDVELITNASADLESVLVDPGQIEQVIMNLAVNSRDAMPNGGRITIETANVTLDHAATRELGGLDPGEYVMLALSDNGSGMDKLTKQRIFEPFFTTKQKGTGLGLSTVFGIVQQSHGAIAVDSEPGKGAAFRIYFPMLSADSDRTETPEPAALGSLAGTETILLVEDEEIVRKLVRTVLKRYGYNVIDAANGDEALALCKKHTDKIDLLLTDMVMPRMNGPEVAMRVKEMRPDAKILFMSGYTELDGPIIHEGILDSEVAFIQKPMNPQALAAKVRQVLSAK